MIRSDQHLQAAIDALNVERELIENKIRALQLVLSPDTEWVNKTVEGPISQQAIVHEEAKPKPKKTVYKQSWKNPRNNTGPVGLRVREIMNDGKARHLHEVLQYFGNGEIDPKSKLYDSVNNALNKLYRSKLLVRISRGVYRRSLKGIKQPPVSMVEPDSTKKRRQADPTSMKSKILGAIATGTEFNAAYLAEGPLKGIMAEKYPDKKNFEKNNKLSSQLANLATQGKLIRVRPGVFIKPASLK